MLSTINHSDDVKHDHTDNGCGPQALRTGLHVVYPKPCQISRHKTRDELAKDISYFFRMLDLSNEFVSFVSNLIQICRYLALATTGELC